MTFTSANSSFGGLSPYALVLAAYQSQVHFAPQRTARVLVDVLRVLRSVLVVLRVHALAHAFRHQLRVLPDHVPQPRGAVVPTRLGARRAYRYA